MKSVSMTARFRYWFDNTMSRGTVALMFWLGVVSLLFIAIMAGIVIVAGLAEAESPRPGFSQIAWRSLLRTLDAGTMGADTGSAGYLLSMLIVTLGGVFIISTLIGVLTSGIEAKVEELRKGRSFVVEEGHTLILGWSPQIFTILSELIEANTNKRRACIVILADRDKVEMDDEIRAKIPDTRTTRIVCRSGNPLDLTDLEITNPSRARSIIVVSPQSEDPDIEVVKTLLALTSQPGRDPERPHIVVELRNSKNLEVAKLVGRSEAQILLVGDLISRITVQACRQSGLSVVYTDLLNFGGDEIYFKEEPKLVGRTFGEALLAYEDSALIGLKTREGTTVNPPMDTRIAAGDRIIVIAPDDDQIRLAENKTKDVHIEEGAIQQPRPSVQRPERTLILGWNQRGPSILRELDHYIARGSQTLVVANLPGFGSQSVPVANQELRFREADTADRRVLDGLGIPEVDHIIVLSYSDRLVPQQADAQTLITLLHLRDMSEQAGRRFSIVSEMLDVRNRELAEVTHADDYIVGDHLVSLLLAQVSEDKDMNAVFTDLFDPEGAEIYLRPAHEYVRAGHEVSLYTVVEAARRRGEVLIGYRKANQLHDAAHAYGVVLNPKKSTRATFTEGDKIIVLSDR